MKRKIEFDITVGSAFPKRDYPVEHMRDVRFPIGGEPTSIRVEFETDGVNPMEDAERALAEKMKGQSYHIWYWTWLS